MSERYVALDWTAVAEQHAEHGPTNVLLGLQPVLKQRDITEIALPPEVHELPPTKDGELVLLTLVADRRHYRTFYYLRCRAGRQRWQIARLGTDLPLSVVDRLRASVAQWNEMRLAVATAESLVTG